MRENQREREKIKEKPKKRMRERTKEKGRERVMTGKRILLEKKKLHFSRLNDKKVTGSLMNESNKIKR